MIESAIHMIKLVDIISMFSIQLVTKKYMRYERKLLQEYRK